VWLAIRRPDLLTRYRAQNVAIWTVHVITALTPTPTHIGGSVRAAPDED
jgi:hypothetical protein